MVNLAAPKTFQFIEYILEKKTFTQYRAAKELGLTMPLINQTTHYLLKRGFIAHDGKQYGLRDAVGLLSAIRLFRDMKDLQLLEMNTSLEKEKVMDSLHVLPKSCIYCLDPALANYSNWWRSNLMCAYIDPADLEEIQMMLVHYPGDKTTVRLFKEKPPVKNPFEAKGKKFTGKIRTIVDLACDKQAHAAQPLFEELWGAKLGPT